jgi:hypothetical protein
MAPAEDKGDATSYELSPLQQIIGHQYFDNFILVVIILNCIFLATQTPGQVCSFYSLH